NETAGFPRCSRWGSGDKLESEVNNGAFINIFWNSTGAREVWGKRLEILKEAIPSTTRAVFLGMRGGWEGSSGQVLREAAARLGISLAFTLPERGTPAEIEHVFAAIEQQRPDAVLVSGEGDLYANRQLVAELSVKHRLPTMCPYRDHVEAGALLGYAVDLAERSGAW